MKFLGKFKLTIFFFLAISWCTHVGYIFHKRNLPNLSTGQREKYFFIIIMQHVDDLLEARYCQHVTVSQKKKEIL
jgi:hypothetical protein